MFIISNWADRGPKDTEDESCSPGRGQQLLLQLGSVQDSSFPSLNMLPEFSVAGMAGWGLCAVRDVLEGQQLAQELGTQKDEHGTAEPGCWLLGLVQS